MTKPTQNTPSAACVSARTSVRTRVLSSLAAFALALLVVFAGTAPAFAAKKASQAPEERMIVELISERFALDGVTVKFTGEVTGTRIDADSGHSWVLVSDAAETISVYMKTADVEQIKTYGAYGVKGDKVEVVGVFHVECAAHDGDIDVHATSVKVTEPGAELDMGNTTSLRTPAIIVIVLGAAAGIVYWRLRERLR